jgi:ABC-type multidrug transport system fused ATPase/permease subunit
VQDTVPVPGSIRTTVGGTEIFGGVPLNRRHGFLAEIRRRIGADPVEGSAAANMGKGHRDLLRRVPSVRVGLTVAVLSGLTAAILLIAQMVFLSRIVRDVIFRHATLDSMGPLLLLTACAMAVRSALTTVRETAARRAAIRTKMELRNRLAAHLLRLGPAHTTDEQSGDLLASATEGIEQLDA